MRRGYVRCGAPETQVRVYVNVAYTGMTGDAYEYVLMRPSTRLHYWAKPDPVPVPALQYQSEGSEAPSTGIHWLPNQVL